jgi:hypothetical protein
MQTGAVSTRGAQRVCSRLARLKLDAHTTFDNPALRAPQIIAHHISECADDLQKGNDIRRIHKTDVPKNGSLLVKPFFCTN